MYAFYVMDEYMGGGKTPRMFNLGVRWRCEVSLCPWRFIFVTGKRPHYPLNMGFDRLQRFSEASGREKMFL
jgi:hypothetical protein